MRCECNNTLLPGRPCGGCGRAWPTEAKCPGCGRWVELEAGGQLGACAGCGWPQVPSDFRLGPCVVCGEPGGFGAGSDEPAHMACREQRATVAGRRG